MSLKLIFISISTALLASACVAIPDNGHYERADRAPYYQNRGGYNHAQWERERAYREQHARNQQLQRDREFRQRLEQRKREEQKREWNKQQQQREWNKRKQEYKHEQRRDHQRYDQKYDRSAKNFGKFKDHHR